MKRKFFRTGLIVAVAFMLIATLSPISALADEPDTGYDQTFIAYKFADKHTLGPAETLTFTILLYNSSTGTEIADVVDTLPAELSYVDGTASGGAVYDAVGNTLTWEGVEVPFGSQVLLTFDAMSMATIAEEMEVTNTAEITKNDKSFDTTFDVTLLPTSPVDDVEFPVVESVVIGDMDALTTNEVTLHIAASDNVGLDMMMIKEWDVGGGAAQGWGEFQSSGWIPFEAEYEYTLGDRPGAKFVGVWVTDEAGNTSFGTRESFDFASYLKEDTTLSGEIGFVPYPVYYEAGVDVTATLDVVPGEDSSATLLVWYPGNFGPADEEGIDEPVVFTTPEAGIYIFVVMVSAPDTLTYNLAITPGGGPSALEETAGSGNLEVLASINAVFDMGLDPIAMALADQPQIAPAILNDVFYLPMMWK